jgi:3-hydroxyacyl-CoA dehydrogenase/enoyl-CoA hydratase/3-hydroxybutyryl-CoA epimerase
MPLVEVVKGAATSDETLATAVDLCKKLGKTPMVVGDCRGFLVNRIFTTSANEVFRLFEEGVAHEKLDHMMLNFGFPMPPFVLADEVGIDVMYKVNHVLEEAYGSRMQSPKVIDAMYEKKLFGKKVKKGFYIYKGKDKSFNPEVYKLMNYKAPNNESMSQMEMSDRVMLLMINEAARCLQEKIVSRPDYLDMALIMGVGFPPFRGGLLRYADSLGINYIVDHLKAFEQKYGSRFAPCDRLLEMQKNGESFY